MIFVDKLIEKIKEKKNPLVIGLDPKIEYVPQFLKDAAFKKYGKNIKGVTEAIFEFNKRIIDSIYDIVPAVKPQLAYYEMYGIDGMIVFNETIKYAKSKGLIVFADGKRNDIGSTAEAYSAAYLGETYLYDGIKAASFDADALTVNPYLGFDGIKPFIGDCEQYDKGIFILVKTSNKSSEQLQDLLTEGGKRIYEVMAEYVEEWGSRITGKNGYSSIGAVVGATYPEQAKILRKIMRHAYILVPGYGAQGGTAKDAVNCFNDDGYGAIINASRSVICAYRSDTWKNEYDEKDFSLASRAEVLRMKDDINKALIKI